jgi:S-adenosylmethionine:tRNA ribosyltransferase-isomerase
MGDASMKAAALTFERPGALQATTPAEVRGRSRDDVRLLVSRPGHREIVPFPSLPAALHRGDLLVVNRSATIPASLPARGPFGRFLLNLSTDYGHGLWLAEARYAVDRPGPVPLAPGDSIEAGGLPASVVAEYPGLPRLAFVRFEGDVRSALDCVGQPIRYGYIGAPVPLAAYGTIFGDRPGSAEMPSAGRPFTRAVLDALAEGGVGLARITLHAGVSSLEIDTEDVSAFPLFPEPFEVPPETVAAVGATRSAGGRVIAVGTTVVRALESATDGCGIVATRGFTRCYVRPDRPPVVVDALLTGFHDSRTSHLAMIAAFGGLPRWNADYADAIAGGLLWHEFGDVHLLFRN